VKRQAAEQRGHWGETVAAWWLRLHGWRIIGQRIRVRQGEVDLIARRRKQIAFIEVKTRATEAELALSIDEYRLRRVVAAANALAPRYAKKGEDIRIDVVLIAPWRMPQHLPNVWHG
jgi:putative endonuclease